MEDSKKNLESSEQMKDVCKVNAQAAIEAGHKNALAGFDAQIDQQKAEIAEREQKIASAEAEIAANEAEITRLTTQNEVATDKTEKRNNEVEIARLNATNKHLRHDIEEYSDAIKMYEKYIASTETKKAEYIKEYEALKAEQLAATSAETAEQAPDIYKARYHVEITIDADSATDEEWAAACKAADHEATFATYDEAVNFIREGKAAAGKAFEGGHVSENIKNGGIIKQVHATSPTLEQMGAEVADILQKIDYAKSRGNNVGARELERKLSSTHQNYYYSIVHFGVDVSREQYEFAFKREIVKHNAKKEMERRNSDKYKAAVKAEAEYDAKQARAIIEANASVEGIEYVAEVKSLLDKAILSGNCSDIVYYAEELKRCLGKMTVPPVAEEATDNSDSIDTNVATEEADTAIKDVELASSDASNFDDAVIKVETSEPTEPQIDSDAALATLSSLALSALAALFNVIKVPDKSAPAEATAAEEAPAAQPVEKPAAAKSELDATREKISKTQDAIKKNTRRLMKLDAKVHGLGTELDFYEKAFKEALVDSAIESYSAPLDELTHIASQIGGKLIDKAKAETKVDTLRARIAKATARLEKLSAKLASLEVGIAAAA